MTKHAYRFLAMLNRSRCMLGFIIALSLTTASVVDAAQNQRAALAEALAKQDHDAIKIAVAMINESMGKKQGLPESRDQFIRIPFDVPLLTKAEAIGSMPASAAYIARHRWWHIGIDPTKLSSPLRESASAIVGLLAFSRASQLVSDGGHANKLTGSIESAPASDQYVEAARAAGDLLIWAQAQAGSGVFPFPASRGNVNTAAFRSAARQLARAEKKGVTNITKNGWAIEDDGDGGLQFDNGECGVAMFALYEATQDNKYLNAAVRSAEWAMQRPLVPNWNYNSFSVRLLARAYLVTGNKSFLDSATQKALLGVIPGQLTQGENKGRWGDAHNARPTYHYIMLDSLVELVAAMRKAKVDRDSAANSVINALRIGLVARNRDLLPTGKGASTKETAMYALLRVNSVFAGDAEFLHATHSREALDGLTKLVSAQFRRGLPPIAPGAWGLLVERLAGH
jgi:hypothetical protein